jgi:phage terminase large subunit
VREVMKDLSESAKLLIEDKISAHGVSASFDCQKALIKTPGDGLIIFRGMRDYNAESIKSLEGFDVAWVEEAQTLSARSLQLLRPTLRKSGSQIWASWNPTRKTDAVDEFFRLAGDESGVALVEANWRDNPWFPDELEQERERDLRLYADQYPHVWEGEYVTAVSGAYYAAGLSQAKQDGRIGKVAADPLLPVRAYWDIGGTGARADACSIWIVQFVGREIRWLDYYEAVGQPLAEHVGWLRSRGYDKALCVLPHDGAAHDKVFAVSYESALRDAGFNVRVVPNLGAGAASKRIEALRRLMPQCWWNEDTTEPGRLALGWYHEKRDTDRGMGLGPNHDWSSHGADAAGLVAVDYEPPRGGGSATVIRNVGWVV